MCIHPHKTNVDKLGRQVENLSFLDTSEQCCDYVELEDCSDISIGETDTSIVQLNIRGLVGKQHELLKLVNNCLGKAKMDIIMLQETWLTKNNEHFVNIPGYKHYGTKRPSCMGGGVSILVNNKL